MRLSIVLVSYHAKEDLARCLDSVFASAGLEPFEVIVVDNASTDGSAAMVAERFPQVHLVASLENVGFARGANLGWARARFPLVLFLNSDTLVPGHSLERLVALLSARPEVGAIGPRLRYSDGALQMSFGKMLSLTSEFLQKCWNAGYARGKGPLRALVERRYSRERYVDWVSGACLLTRRDLLETVGGFDENFFLYSEDIDLCARIRATGARVLYTPDVEVVHVLGRSAAKSRDRSLFESHRSRLYFYEKHYGRTRVALLKLYMGAKAVFSYLLRPADREVYRSVLKLVLQGVDS